MMSFFDLHPVVQYIVGLALLASLVVIPCLTYSISRRLPWRCILTAAVVVPSPVVILHIFFTYGPVLRRTPGLTYLPTLLGWVVPITALMAIGAFVAVFPNWVVNSVFGYNPFKGPPPGYFKPTPRNAYHREVRGPDGRILYVNESEWH